MSAEQAKNQLPVIWTDCTGKTWTLNLIKQPEKHEFAYRNFQAACERAKFQAEKEPDMNLNAVLDELESEFVNGHMGIMSANGVRWIKAPEGQVRLFSICSGVSEEEAQLVMMRQGKEVGEQMEKVINHSFPGLEAQWDPKKKKAAERDPKADGDQAKASAGPAQPEK